MKAIQKPVLSVVATSRNDDHGGNALWRTQHFVNGLAAQALKFEFPIELVLVDWNPPADKNGLYEALDWPKKNPYFSYRVIQVPSEYHNKFKHSDKLPLFQYIAKNVGIKRASADFILSTNIDILFSNELMEFLKTDLKPHFIYGVDRYDTNLKDDVSPNLPFEEVLKLAQQNVVRANMHLGTTSSKFFIGKKSIFKIYMNLLAFVLSIRIFLRYFFIKVPRAIIPSLLHPSSLLTNIQSGLIRFWKDGRKYLRFLKNTIFGSPMTSLHTNACGDFTLLSKKDWEKLKGYPEWELYSWHIDSVLIYQAHHNHIKMHNLPASHTIFHIEHGKGSGWTPEGAKLLFERLDKQGIGYMSDDELVEEFEKQKKLQKEKKPVIYNDDNWGAPHVEFSEKGSLEKA
ncbi:MAG: glycosyltransferase [Alphaproteobacteria bacterium]|nr:glycosyltransferase [Alphaproteobacteria bacterium]